MKYSLHLLYVFTFKYTLNVVSSPLSILCYFYASYVLLFFGQFILFILKMKYRYIVHISLINIGHVGISSQTGTFCYQMIAHTGKSLYHVKDDYQYIKRKTLT